MCGRIARMKEGSKGVRSGQEAGGLRAPHLCGDVALQVRRGTDHHVGTLPHGAAVWSDWGTLPSCWIRQRESTYLGIHESLVHAPFNA